MPYIYVVRLQPLTSSDTVTSFQTLFDDSFMAEPVDSRWSFTQLGSNTIEFNPIVVICIIRLTKAFRDLTKHNAFLKHLTAP